jgi:prepilin-type N-terminal cleavage/methylation domain-containing protein
MLRTARVNDRGFTLIELLVVMIIVGVLASIAVPAFLTQRSRAHDASTKSDVTNVGKEIATYYVDGNGSGLNLDLNVAPGRAVITDQDGYSTSINLTNGTALPSANGVRQLDDADDWCVALTDARGAVKDFSYSARGGLQEGTC